jgi:hypothetical protein
MIFNNVTNTLRNWCNEMTLHYSDEYQLERTRTGQSVRFLSYLVTSELSYQLGTIIDKDYPSFEEYQKAVLKLLPQHIDYALKKELGKIETYYVQSTESAFREYLESVSPDCLSPNVPYNRIIPGEEANITANRFYEAWRYDTTYWYPLNNMPGDDKLFISPARIEPYLHAIYRLLRLPKEHIYEYGESVYDHPYCAEVDELGDYSGCECAFCPKDFAWIIYFSHENTVTFAGAIVPQIKEILRAEMEHWNRFEWDD